MQTLTLTRVHNPIDRADRDTVQWAYVPGQSLAVIRDSLPLEVEFAVSLNGQTVPLDRLDEFYPRPLDHILFVPVLAGGGNGKMIGRLVGMLVVAAVAIWAARLVVGAMAGGLMEMGAAGLAGSLAASSMAVNIVTGGLMIAGGLLINNLMAPPRPKLPSLGNNLDHSQAYSWTPQTLQEQGVTVPMYYGTTRCYGNIIAANLDSDGDKQYTNALISLGLGPVAGVREVMINDQPMGNFREIKTDIRLGDINQAPINYFPSTKIEFPVNRKVTKAAEVTYTTQGQAFDGLDVELVFPGGIYTIDTMTGDQLSGYVNMQVFAAIAGSGNWQNISTQYNATITRELRGYYAIGYQKVMVTPAAESATNSNGGMVLYFEGGPDYRLPDGSQPVEGMVTPYGGTWKIYGDAVRSTDLDGNEYFYFLGAESVPIFVTSVPYIQVSGQNKAKTIRKVLTTQGLTKGHKYDLRIVRLTDDSTNTATIINDSYLGTVREVLHDTFTYPRLALFALNALATDQLSGSLRFSVLVDGRKVRVWDGAAWSFQFSNNPAWVLLDVLTQPVLSNDLTTSGAPGTWAQTTGYSSIIPVRYDGVDPARLDLPKFLELAQWCDDLVLDGKGGTEKRITFNGVFDSEMTLWDAVMQVCQCCGATPVWNGIKLTLAIDKPADPVQLFSVGNMGVDSFTESFLPFEDRAAEIEADFTNSEKGYERDKLTVVNPAIATVTSKVSLQMQGMTKPSEVWRLCQRRLACNQLIARSGTFQADIDAIACTVGDVVLLQHDVPQWGIGGRVVSATITSVTLDQTITIESGKSYSVIVRTLDDGMVERTITNAPGTTATLTVSTPFSTAPSQYDVYAFGEVDKAAKPVRITAISRSGDLRAQLSWIEYNASIYDVDDGIPALPAVNYSGEYITGRAVWQSVGNVTLTESLRKRTGGSIDTILTVSWDMPADRYTFCRAEVFYSNGGAYASAGDCPIDGTLDLTVTDGTTYSVQVRTINILGERQPLDLLPTATHTVIGKTAPPSDITQAVLHGTTITWAAVSDVDLAGYAIRYHVGQRVSWGDAIPMHTGLLSASPYDLKVLPAGEITIMVCAMDTSGNYSRTPAVIVANLGDIVVANVIETIDFAALGWPADGMLMWSANSAVAMWSAADGTDMWKSCLTNGAVSGGQIQANDASGLMWSPDDSAAMWLSPGNAMWPGTYYADMHYHFSAAFNAAVAGGRLYLDYTAQGNRIAINYRPQGPGMMWSAQPNDPMWQADSTVPLWHVPDYMPWPGSVPVAADSYDFEIMTGYGPTRGIVSALTVNVDVPDINETFANVAIGAGGTRLPITQTYRAIKTVNLTMQADGGSARTLEVIDKATNGPLVKAYDSTHTAVTGHADAIIQGY